MSRTSRRAAARKRMQTLLIATVAIVTILLLLVLAHLGEDKPPIPDDSVSGSTSSQTSDTDGTNLTSKSDTDGTENSSQTSKTDKTDSKTDTDESSTSSTTNEGSGNTSDRTESHQEGSFSEPFDFSAWNLILLNPDNPLPEDFKVQLKTITLNGKSRQVDARCADAFVEMVTAAKNDGITLYLRSTYRGIQLQTDSFNAKVQEYIRKGYSKEEATAKTATIIAVPGTSEHHSGLAADITTPSYDRLDSGFENTDAFRWLREHCAEYGFILRYPSDKKEITKIIYEPWHYRYVGKQAAQIIMSEGICYEEFVERYGNTDQ